MFVEEKELTVVCIGLCGLTHTLHTHHVHQPRQVSQECASVQPVVVASGCGMNLCRFQVVVIVVILVLIILLFVIAFLALTCCIMGAVWIAAVNSLTIASL